MNKEEAKELLPAIQHFTNGGDLWYTNINKIEWILQSEIWATQEEGYVRNVIEDRHFEARKAFALGKEMWGSRNGLFWFKVKEPDWTLNFYRPKRPSFEYPLWRKSTCNGIIVRYDDAHDYEIIYVPNDVDMREGSYQKDETYHESIGWVPCDEPVFEWQWYPEPDLDGRYTLNPNFCIDTEADLIMTKFEPSKRIRQRD